MKASGFARRPVLALVVGVLALSLVGCAGATRGKLDDLKESVDAYNTAVRWKNYRQASLYLPNDRRTDFLTYFDEDNPSMHVEGVEILQVDIKSRDAAEVTVRYRYMELPSVVVERKVVTQSWHRIDNRWILEDEDPPLADYTSESTRSAPRPPPEDGWSNADSWDADGPRR